MIEWLIDIIKEWVGAQGFLQTGFVDRGDPAAYDFTSTAFTKDSAWHELDLSGIIPTNVKAVAVSIVVSNTTAGKLFRLRTNGNANTMNNAIINTQVALLFYGSDLIVAPDANRKIEYFATSAGWLTINFTVKGWWF